jgi:hypothetical protein
MEACGYLSRAFAAHPDHGGIASELMNLIAASRNAAALADSFSAVLSKAWVSAPDPVAMHRLLNALAPDDLDRAARIIRDYYRDGGGNADIFIGPIRTVRDWASLTQTPLIEIGEIERIPYRPPVVHGSPASSEIKYGQSNKPYLVEIADARVFSHINLIVPPDGSALSDDAGHEKFGQYISFEYERKLALRRGDRLLLDQSTYRTRKIGPAALLSGLGSESFGHWLPEYLPRIEYFRHHPDFAKLPIVLDADMPKAHFEYLRHMVDNEFILMQPGESLISDRLLVASSPTFLPVHSTVELLTPPSVPGMSPRALQFVRNEMLTGADVRPYRRLFLSRANMQWRRMLNESEVVEALTKRGFEVVHIENMGAAEQVEIFRQAEWIVAPNGSSLLNLIFADPSANVLVLSQPNLYNWGAFQGPMEVLGYRPLFVCGVNVTDMERKHSDYTVAPEQIIAALDSMGLPPVEHRGGA